MTKILNTTTLTFLQETTFIFYTIAFGWIKSPRITFIEAQLKNVGFHLYNGNFYLCDRGLAPGDVCIKLNVTIAPTDLRLTKYCYNSANVPLVPLLSFHAYSPCWLNYIPIYFRLHYWLTYYIIDNPRSWAPIVCWSNLVLSRGRRGNLCKTSNIFM